MIKGKAGSEIERKNNSEKDNQKPMQRQGQDGAGEDHTQAHLKKNNHSSEG